MPQRLSFGTKAETLAWLAPALTTGYVLPQAAMTRAGWLANPEQFLKTLRAQFGEKRLAVRSSAFAEDTADESRAGALLSVLDVDPDGVASAIDRVFDSIPGADASDQVLIQPFLLRARFAGVLSSRDMSTLAPYRVFNYDAETAGTDGVTSGKGTELRTYIRFRDARCEWPNAELERVFATGDEIEQLFDTDRVEVELAIDTEGKVCVFQARRIVSKSDSVPTHVVGDWLRKAGKKIEKLNRPHPHLRGSRTVFGVMPDWNPAEIIGLRPRTLALTMYKEIITDSVWATARDAYGYRDLRSFPLMVSFLGAPYIDVRVSFNSFVPAGVRDELCDKLVDHYIERLIAQPEAHDKVEFEIIHSCFYPGIRKRCDSLRDSGFSAHEVSELLGALQALTGRMVQPHGLWRADLERIAELEQRQRVVVSGTMSSVDKFYWLIEDCKRYGTLAFSGLARAAFVAVQFLKGFVEEGLLTREQHDSFLASLDTVTNRMRRDTTRLSTGEITREEFLASYGHLRPGTYDIGSARYDHDFERYFSAPEAIPSTHSSHSAFTISSVQRDAIQRYIASEAFSISTDQLFSFIRAAIEGREYAKLVFTRSLSDAMSELGRIATQCGLSIDDISHLNVTTALRLYSVLDPQDLRDILRRDIDANRASYEITKAVRLPELIVDHRDVFHFHLSKSEPTFVTLKSVSAATLDERALAPEIVRGKIVFIRSADPGYDWMFAHDIAGLVTQFGGANSHMAIRAAEQGIPAVIGCGEANFEKWRRARLLEIDCANRVVRGIA